MNARRLHGGFVARRGALLLEVILSLAMFAMAAMAILAALTQGTTALERVRDAALAVDLARTAMSEIGRAHV